MPNDPEEPLQGLDPQDAAVDGRGPHEEGELYQALRRVGAPEGFADRVLARLATERDAPGPSTHAPFGPGPAGLGARPAVGLARAWPANGSKWAIAATLLLGLGAPLAGYLHHRQQQARAEATAQQFALAMRVTQEALADVQEQIATTAVAHPRLQPAEPSRPAEQ